MIGDYVHDDPGPAPGLPVEIQLLGPLEIRVDGCPIDLGPRRQRALAALLALHAGEIVSVDQILDALWGEQPPSSARHAVQVYVCALRRALDRSGAGRDVVETKAPGYRLRVPDAAVDARRVEVAAVEAAQVIQEGHLESAREQLGEALAVWRGEPLAEFAYEEFAVDEVRRLDELRLRLIELTVEADLAMGKSGDLVPDLTYLVHHHPGRERLWGMLMKALHRCGRSADALATYTRAAAALSDSLGAAPSPALRRVRRAILSDLDEDDAAPMSPGIESQLPSWTRW